MAFEVLDEHEQGELVQKWLRENALSIVVGVALGLVLIFGWQQWKSHGVRHSAEAASQYQALTKAIDDKQPDEAAKVAELIRKDYQDTVYAVLAALQQADASTKKGDLAAAAAALDWAREHAKDDSLKGLIAARSARVKLAQGDADGALKLVDGMPKGDYAGLAAEIRGDALAKLGRSDDARNAYQDALSNLDAQAPNRGFVQMKLDDLAGTATPTAAPAATPAEPEGKQGT